MLSLPAVVLVTRGCEDTLQIHHMHHMAYELVTGQVTAQIDHTLQLPLVTSLVCHAHSHYD